MISYETENLRNKDTFSQMKRKPPKCEKGFTSYKLDRVLPYRINKELRKKT